MILPKPKDPNPDAIPEVGAAAGQAEEAEEVAAEEEGCPKGAAAEDEEGCPNGTAAGAVGAPDGVAAAEVLPNPEEKGWLAG